MAVRVRHRRARGARRRGRRRGPVAHLEAGRNAVVDLDAELQHDAPGPGDRPAVDLDLPVPPVRRDGILRAHAAGEHPGDVPRDVAGRDPQLLGLPARREGRREPAGGQRGVRDGEGARQRHGPLQRALRHLARRHVQLRPRGIADRVPVLGERGAVQGAGRRRARRAAAVRAHL